MTRFFCSLFFFITTIGLAQGSFKFWVEFKDRNNTPFSTLQPASYLSNKAIERRANQHIAIKENDLPVNTNYIQSVLNISGVTLLNRSKWFNGITIQLTDSSSILQIEQLPFVKSAKRVQKIRSKNSVETILENNSTEYSTSLSSKNSPYNYSESFNQINMIGVDCMHQMGYNGKGKTIAVLDAGFSNANNAPAFDSLWSNHQILGTRDFITGDTMVFEDNSHGSYVLSTMAGYIDGKIIGTAPKAYYWLLRTEEASTEHVIEEDNWVAAAEFADSVGVDIINSSLGYTTFDNPSQDHTYADMDGNTTRISIGADIAASKGILVVNSAGNSGNNPWFYISAPADGDSVLAVGAVNANRDYVTFSSKGPSYDKRIKPNVSAQGAGAVVASLFSNGIEFANGTSFSSPIIAGAAACLWQANLGKTNMDLFYAIQNSASQYNNPDSLIGYGIPNFCIANELLKNGNNMGFLQDDNLLRIYPNPFKETIEFVFYSKNKQELKIELIDISGKQILYYTKPVIENSYHLLQLNELENVATGIYILRITSDTKQHYQKLVKN